MCHRVELYAILWMYQHIRTSENVQYLMDKQGSKFIEIYPIFNNEEQDCNIDNIDF